MEAGRDDHAVLRAGVDVDVWIDAALADEPQRREPRQQRRLNLRPLADEDQHFALLKTIGEHAHIVYVIVPDRHVKRRQLRKARQRVQGVEVVIQDGHRDRAPIACRAAEGCQAGPATRRFGGAVEKFERQRARRRRVNAAHTGFSGKRFSRSAARDSDISGPMLRPAL